jgi:hypothetical protein
MGGDGRRWVVRGLRDGVFLSLARAKLVTRELELSGTVVARVFGSRQRGARRNWNKSRGRDVEARRNRRVSCARGMGRESRDVEVVEVVGVRISVGNREGRGCLFRRGARGLNKSGRRRGAGLR